MPTTQSMEAARQKELERVRKKNGGTLLAENVLEFAKSPKTALHSCFEWDDSKAAHMHRLEQARKVIRVYVQPIETPSGEEQHRRYVHIRGSAGYRPIDEVMGNEDLQQKYMETVEQDFRAFQRRWQAARALTKRNQMRLEPLWDAADRVFGRDDEGPRAEL